MITIDHFVKEVEAADIRITVDSTGLEALRPARDDAFFQTPLLSLCLIVIARDMDGRLDTANVPTWVGATLTKHFDDSSAIRKQLEWSLDYRHRCADCIVFLENVGLITVALSSVRSIRCTERGSRFVREALKKADEIGVLTRALMKAHRIVEYHGLELL
jgi:hypothetical protein